MGSWKLETRKRSTAAVFLILTVFLVRFVFVSDPLERRLDEISVTGRIEYPYGFDLEKEQDQLAVANYIEKNSKDYRKVSAGLFVLCTVNEYSDRIRDLLWQWMFHNDPNLSNQALSRYANQRAGRKEIGKIVEAIDSAEDGRKKETLLHLLRGVNISSPDVFPTIVRCLETGEEGTWYCAAQLFTVGQYQLPQVHDILLSRTWEPGTSCRAMQFLALHASNYKFSNMVDEASAAKQVDDETLRSRIEAVINETQTALEIP